MNIYIDLKYLLTNNCVTPFVTANEAIIRPFPMISHQKLSDIPIHKYSEEWVSDYGLMQSGQN